MILQDKIWLIALIGIGLVALGFLYVISQAGKQAEPAAAQRSSQIFNTVRRGLFIALLLLGIAVAYKTLWPFPIPPQHAALKAEQVVEVVGRQWQWQLSTAQVKAGVPIEFRITSADVNHGFALYGPDDRIIVQTQAMPGFENRILHTFKEPGIYRILCLEYCGVAHHGMVSQIEVLANPEAGS
ncbi:MAG: hypothetical protein KUL86_03020 [Castellaniella sp.]|nr:hypothetical protein [Castellaniella sp.]